MTEHRPPDRFIALLTVRLEALLRLLFYSGRVLGGRLRALLRVGGSSGTYLEIP